MPWFFRSEEDRYLDQCEADVLEWFRQNKRREADLVKYIKTNFSVRGRLEIVGGTFYPSHWSCEGKNYNGETPEQTFQKLVSLADGNIALAQEVVRRCQEITAHNPDIDEKMTLVLKARSKMISITGDVRWTSASD